ncbi:MAG TPA: PHB depolymerase family esterase [Polyangia bacterium]|nr:PHB depolymerase family esterase [Polyangia bacterium]
MRNRARHASLFFALLGALFAFPAAAASLEQVSDWGATGVPSYVAMYIYVPDKLATKPPILVVSHYCSGDAAGVYNEAKSGGIVAAADKYGFIMIFPQNHLPNTTRNCWDVGSTASLTHDGGGDTQAIAEMVKYTITKYGANADRVYATGTSSGAMMTEALLAVYPEVFKAGAEFSGVPAGCWASSYTSSNQWSGPCAGGTVSNTAQQWGDMVRAMDKAYTGHRPRIQLWHGTADPTINYNNQTEAIKEWTNVLGLPTAPTTTMTVSLASKTWTRQSWKDSCGSIVLDAWAEQNGPHGTSANLNATYTIPFLALDKAGDVDPDLAACGGGGGGAGGAATATGGSPGGGGAGGRAVSNTGGAGGVAATGGHSGTGGAVVTGSGGAAGAPGAGGRLGTGGFVTATGGRGNDATGGTSTTGAGGSLGTGGSTESGDNSGCSCVMGGAPTGGAATFLGAAASLLLAFARRRRPRS